MAVAMLGNRSNYIIRLPYVASVTKLKIICNLSNMATRCKAGRNKLYKVKPSTRKLMIADEIRSVFEMNNMVIVCQFSDMNTAEWEDLRYILGKDEIAVKLFPNKITCKALENTKYREILPLFLAATVVTYSKEAKVKTLLTELKKQPKMGILGGKVDGKLLSRKGVVDYAKLPPITEQYGQLLHMVTEHSRRLTTLLEQNQMNLITNLTQYVSEDKVES